MASYAIYGQFSGGVFMVGYDADRGLSVWVGAQETTSVAVSGAVLAQWSWGEGWTAPQSYLGASIPSGSPLPIVPTVLENATTHDRSISVGITSSGADLVEGGVAIEGGLANRLPDFLASPEITAGAIDIQGYWSLIPQFSDVPTALAWGLTRGVRNPLYDDYPIDIIYGGYRAPASAGLQPISPEDHISEDDYIITPRPHLDISMLAEDDDGMSDGYNGAPNAGSGPASGLPPQYDPTADYVSDDDYDHTPARKLPPTIAAVVIRVSAGTADLRQ